MTIEEALQLIDRVLANMQGTRQDHLAVQEAFKVVCDAVNPTEDAVIVED